MDQPSPARSLLFPGWPWIRLITIFLATTLFSFLPVRICVSLLHQPSVRQNPILLSFRLLRADGVAPHWTASFVLPPNFLPPVDSNAASHGSTLISARHNYGDASASLDPQYEYPFSKRGSRWWTGFSDDLFFRWGCPLSRGSDAAGCLHHVSFCHPLRGSSSVKPVSINARRPPH